VKILLVAAELFHAERYVDRQTDRQRHVTKLIIALRNFANAQKKKAK